MATRPTVIYVMSPARSGSTVVGQVLGSQTGCVCVGEVLRIQGYAMRDEAVARARMQLSQELNCTCGLPVLECPFWKSVADRSGLALPTTTFMARPGRYRVWTMVAVHTVLGGAGVFALGFLLPSVRRDLDAARNCFRLYDAVAEVSGANIIVDSSKAPLQYLMLKALFPRRVRLLMLVRDGRGVVLSMVRAGRDVVFDPRNGAPFAQAVKSWVRRLWQIRCVLWRTRPDERIVVRYEEFCRDPAGTVRNLTSHFGWPAGEILGEVEIRDCHNIGGSPSRLERKDGSIRLDEGWRQTFTPEDRCIFDRFGGRTNRSLGYTD